MSDNHDKSMSSSSAIRIVRPCEFDKGTLQTPGSERQAAVGPQTGVESKLWAGVFEVKQGARTGIHHHGVQHTVAYVLSGVCEVRWGANGEFARDAQAVHRAINRCSGSLGRVLVLEDHRQVARRAAFR